jgi:2'-5' RNA ligase
MIKPPADRAAEIYGLPEVDRTRDATLLHGTILPIGDRVRMERDLDRAIGALEKLDVMPFEVCFDRLVAKPGSTAKLISSGGRPAAAGLYRAALSALKRARIEVGPYRFSLHVTLHYRSPGPMIDRPIEPIRWTVGELLLIESHHGEKRHVELCRWPLLPRQGLLFPLRRCDGLAAA